MRYAVVTENAKGNYSAYVPDLPGCVATGATVERVEREIAQQSGSTSKGCGLTGSKCLNRRA